MLTSLFNRFAKLPFSLKKSPEKTLVMVSTMGDDKTRGDSHGYIGLGQTIAQKMGGIYHYVDEDVLKTDYPAARIRDSFSLYFHDIGMPDIIFARNYSWQTPYQSLAPDKDPFIINDFNEFVSRDHTGKTNAHRLVAHHLTPALLQAEGARFRKAYPDIKGSLTAVLLADDNIDGLAEALEPSYRDLSGGHIFVCSSRRTDSKTHDQAMLSLYKAVTSRGAEKNITISGYNFNRERAGNTGMTPYNPYIGLLKEADHILVCGHSGSIVSESLMTGKNIHMLYDNSSYPALIRDGAIRILSPFNQAALQTRAIKPLDPTPVIADRIIDAYRQREKRRTSLIGRINACFS